MVAALRVSTETAARGASACTTGNSLACSTAGSTGCAPGRVLSAPRSRISAPAASIASPARIADVGVASDPPSLKLSGVRFRMPMTRTVPVGQR